MCKWLWDQGGGFSTRGWLSELLGRGFIFPFISCHFIPCRWETGWAFSAGKEIVPSCAAVIVAYLLTANVHIMACRVCEADVDEQRGGGEEVGVDLGDGAG